MVQPWDFKVSRFGNFGGLGMPHDFSPRVVLGLWSDSLRYT